MSGDSPPLVSEPNHLFLQKQETTNAPQEQRKPWTAAALSCTIYEHLQMSLQPIRTIRISRTLAFRKLKVPSKHVAKLLSFSMRTSPGDTAVHRPACLPTGLRENTHFCAESGVKSGFFSPAHGGRSSAAAARGRLTVTWPWGDAFMDLQQHAGGSRSGAAWMHMSFFIR